VAFWRWAEERIEAAIQSGEFDALAGRGRPLRLETDPLAPADERLARHIMQNAGVKPAWVELADEIQAHLSAAREDLLRAVSRLSPDHPDLENAIKRFDRRVAEINALIKRYNLLIPNPRLARVLVDAAGERKRLLNSRPPEA
jgi:DnaJ family protein C protein 28